MIFNSLKTLYEHGLITRERLFAATQPPLSLITEEQYELIVGE